ncbi:SMC family ATPase [archaeon]|jgi:DNA repair protein SbcC/Rad50|nr:SMC family ATPase [archaeon]MBT3451400.1 SMC family ATPase [archaeon]MBT6869009.1 SMC family ATPase [archaeon]MBT7193275.1 SMC family ATPase [archaeon]MBT7380130.1 SMC family ATPase [archaeon]
MLLKKLVISNIRSYEYQEIQFPKGSILLSGDIGSGKSTILLAIEFALFGTSRTELSGDSLLRKGENSAEVELHFVIEEKEVIIKRTLKRTSRGVNQGNGYVIINNVKKELTPIELKAEILNLLSYPEDLLSKGKNYVFRYTVYCPQEDMKLILQETPENRLDILRKIFNIDRYKTIRDNLQTYLKIQRKEIIILETRIEPLADFQIKLVKVEEEISNQEKVIEELIPKKELALSKVKEDKQKLEHKIKSRDEIKVQLNELKQKKTLVRENNERLEHIKIDHEQIVEKLKVSLIDTKLNKVSIDTETISLENEKTSFLREKTQLNSNIKNCQERIFNLQIEMKSVQQGVEQKKELIKKTDELISNVKDQQELVNEYEKSLNLEKKNLELVSINQTLLSEANKLKSRIVEIEKCPTCLQEISSEYKQNISQTEHEKIVKSELILQELFSKEQEIKLKINQSKQSIEFNNRLNEELRRLSFEIKSIEEKEKLLDLRKEELIRLVIENNNFTTRLGKLQENEKINLDRINQRLKQLNNLKEKIILKENLELQKSRIEIEIKRINDKNELLNKNISEIEFLLEKSLDLEILQQEIEQQEIKLNKLIEEERNISLEEAKLNASLKYLNKDKLNITKNVEDLKSEKSKLIRTKELYNWLNNFFFRLTFTIEKEILGNIYNYFNQTFKEWFNILMEDENINAKLDDSFTPIVEQNGYEISFNDLSGGEKTSVSLAYRLSLNKVINDVISEIKTNDILILDEPTDGFSTEQLDKVRDLLESISLKQVIIVSHEAKVESFVENMLRIVKEDGISRIVN